MTVLVTGGAGFIGANFIFYWLKAHPGDRVVCVDKLTYAGNLSTLSAALERPEFRFVRADICDREIMDRLFGEERPDAVVNFAAESHVDRSIKDPEVFLRTNVMGTAVLLDACRRYGTPQFHQVSTDGFVSGPSGPALYREDTPAGQFTLQCIKGVGGFADLVLLPYLRPASDGFPLFQ